MYVFFCVTGKNSIYSNFILCLYMFFSLLQVRIALIPISFCAYICFFSLLQVRIALQVCILKVHLCAHARGSVSHVWCTYIYIYIYVYSLYIILVFFFVLNIYKENLPNSNPCTNPFRYILAEINIYSLQHIPS